MNANEAYKKTNDKHADLIKQQMSRIMTSINKAINKGLFETMIYETVFNENRDQLQEKGFQVFRRGGRMGEHSSLIKWGNADEEPENNDSFNSYYPASTTPKYPL